MKIGAYSAEYITEKIKDLEEIENQSAEDLCDETFQGNIAAGICMNEGCDFTANVVYNCSDGLCEECNTGTVWSILELFL